MSSFTEQLQIAPTSTKGGSVTWCTLREFRYDIGAKNSGWSITVPQGTETDLGSIPSWARFLTNPANPKYCAAYVLHDYLCVNSGVNRFLTDSILYEALLVLKMPKPLAALIYTGVSIYRVFLLPIKLKWADLVA